ncbi:MAG TPA: hypothetical protein VK615_02950 [Candidatus Binatia bacterium]|nr:hypothetical protein [Candidatus Binatia bacterium]
MRPSPQKVYAKEAKEKNHQKKESEETRQKNPEIGPDSEAETGRSTH